MELLTKLIGSAAGNITQAVGNILDETITSVEEKQAKKNELAQIITNNLSEVISYQRDILSKELEGSPLQRNWRPIVMLCFCGIVVYRYFLTPVFHFEQIELPEKFWDLLELGLGGYVIGRSVEKVAETFTKNVDMPFIKKKNRNESK